MGVVYVPTAVPAGLIFLPVTFHRHKNLFFFSEKKMRNTTQAFLKKRNPLQKNVFKSYSCKRRDTAQNVLGTLYTLSLSLGHRARE